MHPFAFERKTWITYLHSRSMGSVQSYLLHRGASAHYFKHMRPKKLEHQLHQCGNTKNNTVIIFVKIYAYHEPQQWFIVGTSESRRGPQSKTTQKPASIFPDNNGQYWLGKTKPKKSFQIDPKYFQTVATELAKFSTD